MPASDSLSFDDGIFTASCMATLPLRMRVSMSAIGSVIVIVGAPPSPACLGHAGHFAGVRKVAQADSTQPELAEHGARPTTPAAPGVGLHLVLGLALLLLNECLLGHYNCCPSRRNGNPKAASRARPSSFVRAVVTMVMSMPRVVSILS